MNEIQLARTFYAAEKLGGAFYDRFCRHVGNQDVAEVFDGFAGEEHTHARWYADFLGARGHAPPPVTDVERVLMPSLRLVLAPQPLAVKLRTFALTEHAAAQHLRSLATRVRDPELRSIIEKTIPFEHKHSIWYREQGHRMLRRRDYVL